MGISSLKIRLAVLWIFLTVAWVIWLVTLLYGQMMSGEAAETEVLTIVLVVPLIMAFLSVTLKDSTNRGANIIMGIFFTGLMTVALAGSLVAFRPVNEILLEASKVAVSALIAWYSYKWPKEEA